MPLFTITNPTIITMFHNNSITATAVSYSSSSPYSKPYQNYYYNEYHEGILEIAKGFQLVDNTMVGAVKEK